MRVFVDEVRALRFDGGTPVTAASGIAPLGDGWLVAQDVPVGQSRSYDLGDVGGVGWR